jgi:ASCH domain
MPEPSSSRRLPARLPAKSPHVRSLAPSRRASNLPARRSTRTPTRSPAAPYGSGTAQPFLALSIRQPFAELVMRGAKRIEFRSRRTHVRGRILIYATLRRLAPPDEARIARRYRLDTDALPHGVIVGSVELHRCTADPRGDGWRWHLRCPVRAKRLRKPKGRPQPVWFRAW